MAESSQDFDLSQRSLTVSLVLERRDLLDGHFLVRYGISRRPEIKISRLEPTVLADCVPRGGDECEVPNARLL